MAKSAIKAKPLQKGKDAQPETARASLELLYNISREFAAALDLRTVLQRVLFLSVQYIGAISGSVIVLDDLGKPINSALIFRNQFHEHITRQLRDTLDHGLAGWVVKNRQPALVQDTSKDPRWLRRPDDDPAQTGPKSAVSAPILARDRLVGVLTLVHPQPGRFNLDHFELIQSIADQAGIAIVNARLYAESQRQARVMTAVAESAAVITASLNPDEVLNRILEQVSQALRVEVVSLALLDKNSHVLEFRATTSADKNKIIGRKLELGQGVAGWVALKGRGAVVHDAYSDPRFYPDIDQRTGFKTQAIASAPVLLQGEVIGVIEAINPLDGKFDQDALLVLAGVGNLAGTAIRHAELFESLQAAHKRYRELFEDSIEPIIVTDWQGRIFEANRYAKVTIGIDDEALRNYSITHLHGIDWAKVGSAFENLAAGETISYESLLYITDEQEMPVQVYVRKVHIEGVAYLQWIFRDLTERKRLDRLREDMASMIFHDLRSPLGNIVSSLDILSTLLPENEEGPHSLVDIAMRSTERIQRLTNSLLDISHLEAGQPLGNCQPIAIWTLVDDAVDALAAIAKNKKQQIDLAIPADLPEVSVDQDMIRRVLINLIENAVKFSSSEGKIAIGAKAEGTEIVVWVKDNGPGIPPGEQGRIFEKFIRLQQKDEPKGLGLGLAYCRLAIQAHGGRIWVESEAGNGAAFFFTLPVIPQDLMA